jgi:hypothetical protein
LKFVFFFVWDFLHGILFLESIFLLVFEFNFFEVEICIFLFGVNGFFELKKYTGQCRTTLTRGSKKHLLRRCAIKLLARVPSAIFTFSHWHKFTPSCIYLNLQFMFFENFLSYFIFPLKFKFPDVKKILIRTCTSIQFLFNFIPKFTLPNTWFFTVGGRRASHPRESGCTYIHSKDRENWLPKAQPFY